MDDNILGPEERLLKWTGAEKVRTKEICES